MGSICCCFECNYDENDDDDVFDDMELQQRKLPIINILEEKTKKRPIENSERTRIKQTIDLNYYTESLHQVYVSNESSAFINFLENKQELNALAKKLESSDEKPPNSIIELQRSFNEVDIEKKLQDLRNFSFDEGKRFEASNASRCKRSEITKNRQQQNQILKNSLVERVSALPVESSDLFMNTHEVQKGDKKNNNRHNGNAGEPFLLVDEF